MQKLLGYLLIFGLPVVAYSVWLARFTKRLHFFLLLAALVMAIWGALWPLYYAGEHWKTTVQQRGDASDSVMIGFIFLGPLYGVIGCLPIILVEIARSVVLLMRKGKGGESVGGM